MAAQNHGPASDFFGLADGGPERRAAISHELRTPLTIIAGYVEILRGQGDRLTLKQQKMLATVDRNTAKLQRLIEDILDRSQVEANAFKAARSPVSLAALAEAAIASVQPQAEAAGTTVTGRCEVEGLTVHGDPGQLARLLRTLLSCAVMSAPRGSRVEVQADRDGAAAVLRVTGAGIGSAALGPSPAAAAASVSLCRTIAANHGGELELEPSSMTVRVPLPASDRLSVVR